MSVQAVMSRNCKNKTNKKQTSSCLVINNHPKADKHGSLQQASITAATLQIKYRCKVLIN